LFEFPDIKTIDLSFELYDDKGRLVKEWEDPKVSVGRPYLIDSRHFQESFFSPKNYHIPTPFSGSLLIKQKINDLSDAQIFNKLGGFFASASNYIDYYQEGSFVTTLHDYSAYLPDQGMNRACLGLIPAFCDEERETFFIVHAAKAGIGRRDLKIFLYNAKGEKRITPLPPLPPFGLHKIHLSTLVSDAKEFLGGKSGQIEIEGIFRQLMTRIAYGVHQKASGAFSLDHCYYSRLKDAHPLSAVQREKVKKGYFNPFLILENEQVTTSVTLFQSEHEPWKKCLDLLIYDEGGKCVFVKPLVLEMQGNRVETIEMGKVLQGAGISLPFVGHGEVLRHLDSEQKDYSRDLDLYLEFRQKNSLANVIFGSKVWNPPEEIGNKSSLISYGCRVICDEIHTTYLGISNCSYDYDYHLDVQFHLDLVVNGAVAARSTLSIGPECTLFKSVEEYFPKAKEELSRSGGVGLLSYTILNSNYLVTVFLTQDRKSEALSLEHTVQTPLFPLIMSNNELSRSSGIPEHLHSERSVPRV
ncbi:MAG: hypothetical protein HY391_00225, partial [Deltaproteobacteria bacterium]|nr:hypothetical protein [Deltaproteobacteria bacterium]